MPLRMPQPFAVHAGRSRARACASGPATMLSWIVSTCLLAGALTVGAIQILALDVGAWPCGVPAAARCPGRQLHGSRVVRLFTLTV